MEQNKLVEILEMHKKWWLLQEGGKQADLHKADLHKADLRGIKLCEADLSGADLSEADLRGANLCGSNLREAKLHGANLRGANLYGVNLYGADLCETDLLGVVLCGADLRRVDFCGVDLGGADLTGADLHGAKNIPYIPMSCPSTGSFIGWKKAENYIIRLQILDDSLRSSAVSRECRCNKALVLGIENIDGSTANIQSIPSDFDESFVYTVGKIVSVNNFCMDRFDDDAPGIYFFIDREEAVQYQ